MEKQQQLNRTRVEGHFDVQQPKKIIHSVVGMTLLAVAAMVCSAPSVAQELRGEENVLEQRQINPMMPISPAYTLGGGDLVNVNILGLPEYSGQYQIPVDGRLNLPLIGTVNLEGLTSEEASRAIEAAYQGVIRRPQIAVSLVAPRPLNVWVSGEVTRPGSYIMRLTPGAGNIPGVQYPTVVQALEIAQGVTLAADISQVQVRRLSRAGQEQVFTLDLWAMLQLGDGRQDITLRDGDVIFVPTSPQVNLEQTRQLATTSFSRDTELPRTVAVVGSVERPGTYTILGSETGEGIRAAGLPTMTRAIQLAGGIQPDADIRQIQLRRPTITGGDQVLNLNLWQLLQTGDFTQDPILQNGDTIFIPTASFINPNEAGVLATTNFSPEAIQVNVVGEVVRPGNLRLPPNTPLNQALLAAGGFDPNRAKQDRVELLRLNPNGTVFQRIISIDLDAAINEETNPILRDNDIVVINRSRLATFGDTVNTATGFSSNATGFLRIFDFFGIFDYLRLPRR
ncbi:SLBB domain-containing protein [Laspinema olomoucense]|uniref:SLBB domain-containing protein n=1 Tax=Laspinema olomoucense D3b TaxID=2953688 RepID=A0ABT2N6R9_9CYAN|nr:MULTISPECIES: SLBB domain-containing protein [unclassified Laspinema]MCT7972258.1 SLBB domain-containing protein [Laspinema sp. D3d]MCT7978394.1 SLBB domain-containing protein [Laspinema sp. D3b]